MKKFQDMGLYEQIKVVKNFVKLNNPDHHVVVDKLLHLNKITGKTYITLKANIGSHERRVQWRHLKVRGIKSPNNAMQSATLYIALFENLLTGELHPKLGSTTFVNYEERFHHASKEWKFKKVIYERSGPLLEILALEREMNAIKKQYNMQQPKVTNFTWGGKTEVLKPFIEITTLYNEGWTKMIQKITYKSLFD